MKKKWKGWLAGPLAAFVLAASAAYATPAINGTAEAVDVDNKSCTLTVRPGSEDYAADLAKASVVMDVYKIARAVADSNYDTYSYQFQENYAGLKVSAKPDNEEWNALAQQAADIVLNSAISPAASGEAGQPIALPADKDLGCGLYLVIARGSNLTDYVTKVKNEEGREEIATIAQSDEYTYTFAPSLISLPNKEGNNTAADAGDWIYDETVTLKPQRAIRFGSLEIVKNLQTYETKDPADFVFEIEAKVGEGDTERVVFSGVEMITFTEPGQKSVLIENKIPVGARVTVKEVYSGNVYQVVTADTQTTIIQANEIVSVAFTNDYDETNKGGGAVTNHFEYNDGWNWTPIYDRTDEE